MTILLDFVTRKNDAINLSWLMAAANHKEFEKLWVEKYFFTKIKDIALRMFSCSNLFEGVLNLKYYQIISIF